MKIKNFKIAGLKLIKTKIHYDKRGFFKEIYKEKILKKKFLFYVMSYSKKNVLRGLHLQTKKPQAKLITVMNGKILDVAVDLRKKSKNFGKYYSIIISKKSNFSLYIPEGFAHGFLTLTGSAEFLYKTNNYYSAESERSILWKDNVINIQWPSLGTIKPILTEKDMASPSFNEAELPFPEQLRI